MDDSLRLETEKLGRAWARHDADFLRDYLVADVEDPRINVQSTLSRHFLLAALFGEKFRELMKEELRFAAAMNWLLSLAKPPRTAEDLQLALWALTRGADNAEGIEIPPFIARVFASLPATANAMDIPNYIVRFLSEAQLRPGGATLDAPGLNTFLTLWNNALRHESAPCHSVLEPACGSANDYRFLDACGISRLIDYSGFDLCEKNVANARALFPRVRFAVGNVFAIEAPDKTFDLCLVHDLLEHLSPAGLTRAVAELCRVTRQSLCVGFFQMDEIPDHVVRPAGDYHVNTLSMEKTKALFARHGFAAQVLHIGSYLRWHVGCPETHNPNAYTFLLFRR